MFPSLPCIRPFCGEAPGHVPLESPSLCDFTPSPCKMHCYLHFTGEEAEGQTCPMSQGLGAGSQVVNPACRQAGTGFPATSLIIPLCSKQDLNRKTHRAYWGGGKETDPYGSTVVGSETYCHLEEALALEEGM